MSLSQVSGCLSCQCGISAELLLPHLSGIAVEGAELAGGRVCLRARVRAGDGACPGCGQRSGRVHSVYQRTLADQPWGGRRVVIRLTVRRFFCGDAACPKTTFAEQVAGLTVRHGRRTPPLTRALTAIALALAGRAGARLAALLGYLVSKTSLLRLIMALPDPVPGVVRVLGVDDFAFRRGQSYGTVLVSMETGKVVDVLPDREADTLQAWLTAHPGTEVICRDRAGAYALGARAGAPDAIQVADRWHLWHNLAGYIATAVSRHRAELALVHPRPAPVTAEDQVSAVITARWEQIQALRAQGKDLPAAAAALGLGTATASRYWNAPRPASLLAARAATILDPWKPYLRQQWEQGITRITVLHRQITALGCTGSYGTTLAFLTRWKLAAPPPPPPPPARRQATRLILSDPAHLSPADQALLDQILARCPAIAALASHITAFAAILTSQDPGAPAALSTWITTIETGPAQPELHSFTQGLHQDRDAIDNALTLPWNSGRVEGHVNRIKLIKRQMYGRARYLLLRKRILHAT